MTYVLVTMLGLALCLLFWAGGLLRQKKSVRVLIGPDLDKLAALLRDGGATRVNLVGGAVIDLLRGKTPKDWDVEVFGISVERIAAILESAGVQADQTGKAFGVVKARMGDLEVDLSTPRRDNRIGIGHKDFSVSFDPSMTVRDAARRRDFTINSIAIDLATGEILDPFNGLGDLKQGVLRATDPKHFVEDPLRVLRAMQLAARKAPKVAPETMRLFQSMATEENFRSLAKERIVEEFDKLLLKAERPSIGLRVLFESGWLVFFPELYALVGCQQNPRWHPEGDVWTHTLSVVDAAARCRGKLQASDARVLMYAVLLHDVGKPVSSRIEDGVIRSKGHDVTGGPLTGEFLTRLTDEVELARMVRLLTEAHMRPFAMWKSEAAEGAWRRLHNAVDGRTDLLGWLSLCDWAGIGNDSRISRLPDIPDDRPSGLCFSWFEKLGQKQIDPLLMGRHLIAAGMKPGKEFGPILKRAYEYQLDNPDADREEILGAILSIL